MAQILRYRSVQEPPNTPRSVVGPVGGLSPLPPPDIAVEGDAKNSFWTIKWRLEFPSLSGGWIIQKVTIQSTTPGGWFSKDIVDSPKTYWEAWRVDPGSMTTYLKEPHTNQPSLIDDNLGFRGIRPGHGEMKFTTSAKFYEGLTLPGVFGTGLGAAGVLPATYDDPKISPELGTEPLNRTFIVRW